MESVLAAEFAVFHDFNSVRVVLLVFLGVVIALLALGTSKSDFNSHSFGTSYLIARIFRDSLPHLVGTPFIPTGEFACVCEKAHKKINPFFEVSTF